MRTAFIVTLLTLLTVEPASAETLLNQQSVWKFSPAFETGWEQPEFDDSAWSSGVAPFTSFPNGCSLSLLGEEGFTFWDLNTAVYLRTTFQSDGGQAAFRTAVDNNLSLYLNGTFVQSISNSGCTYYWEDTINLPDNLVVPGTNTLAIKAEDFGNLTYFDGMVETYDALLVLAGSGTPAAGNGGISWLDLNGDSYDDVVVVVGGGPNRLYANETDGTFTEIVTGDLVTGSFAGTSASSADYNNDGFVDVFVTNQSSQRDRLFTGNGGYEPDEVTSVPPTVLTRSSGGAGWADYDLDGDVDLFVAIQNGDNLLYRNNGDGTFSQVTTGSVVTDGGNSNGCSWIDYDTDGDPDLYVYNNGDNFLYRNDGGELVRIMGLPITTDGKNSRGGTWGDYDNDLDPDLFVSNHDAENDFYENVGNGDFVQRPGIGVTVGADESRGCSWADYDNDGDLDLVLVNRGSAERDYLFENAGSGVFNVKGSEPISIGTAPSFGSAWCDVENDGDLDLLISNNAGSSFFLNSGNENQWIEMSLIGTVSNRSAIGARITLKTEQGWQTREISSQDGAYSQSSLTAHFGLGGASVVDTLIVRWPSGIVWDTTGVAPNQRLVLTEVDENTGVDGEPETLAIQSHNEPNPFVSRTEIRYRLQTASRVSIRIFDVAGRMVRLLESDAEEGPGDRAAIWDAMDGRGRSVPSGTYFYRLEASGTEVIRRMTILR